MEIVFTETTIGGIKVWQSEFTALAAFNLHVELETFSAWIEIAYRGDEGQKYSRHYSQHFYNAMDMDFVNAVYPKQVRITLTKKPKSVTLLFASAVSGDVDGLVRDIEEQKRINAEQQVLIEKAMADNAKMQEVLPIEDADGNGVPDGVDRLNRMEEAIPQPMTEEELGAIREIIK